MRAAGMVGSAGTAGGAVTQAGELRSRRVESLRALAALAVLEGHVFGIAHNFGASAYEGFWHRALLGGGYGVFMFFTLSGYLLFLPFARAWLEPSPRRVDLWRYAGNRALRILPLYWVACVLLLVAEGWPTSDWWRFFVLFESFSHRTVAQMDGPMWSLVVEVHFYLLLPLVAWALCRGARGSIGRAAALLAALGVVLLALRAMTAELPSPVDPVWQYSLPANAFYFVPGMALALLRLAWERRPPVLPPGLDRADVWLLAAVPLWALIFWSYRLGDLAGPASFLMVAACVLPLRSGPLVGAVGWRPLAALGVASYSLYIWHLPLALAIGAASWAPAGTLGLLVIIAPVSVVVAVASYLVVERPFLRLRRRWGEAPAPDRAGAVAGG
ncbi:MAG TPA: acyltransferase [Acidimicrobiales bacterium]|nr:acyltransferase [Acidimicrobiales bacterium]